MPLDTRMWLLSGVSPGNPQKWPKHAPTWPGLSEDTGGRLNKKDGLTRYGDSHVKDKTS